MILTKRMKDYNIVHAVEKFGAESPFQIREDPLFHPFMGAFFVGSAEAERGAVRESSPHVGGHDHQSVAKINGASFPVGKPPIFENLQQHIEDIGMRFLDLIEKHHRVGLTAHLLGELAALVVPNVARGGPDEPGGGVLLHVLGHIQPDHGPFIPEYRLGQSPGQLGFAYPGGAEKDK